LVGEGQRLSGGVDYTFPINAVCGQQFSRCDIPLAKADPAGFHAVAIRTKFCDGYEQVCTKSGADFQHLFPEEWRISLNIPRTFKTF
jgi:hypothetical protein